MPATNALECQTAKSARRQQPDSPLNEEWDLIVQARNGSPTAIELLVSRYESRLFHLARNITFNHEDAEEVVQNAFVKPFQHLATFRGDICFYIWLMSITVNEALMKTGLFAPYSHLYFFKRRQRPGRGSHWTAPTYDRGRLSSADRSRSGTASAVVNAARQTGGTIGVAIYGAMMGSEPAQIIRGLELALLTSVGLLLLEPSQSSPEWRSPSRRE